MGVDAHTFRRALGDNLLVGRGIVVVDLREEAIKGEVVGFLTTRVFLAEVAAHTADAANLAHFWSAHGIIAKNVDGRRRWDKFDEFLRAGGNTLTAADTKALIDYGESIADRNRMLGADVRASTITEAAELAALIAAGSSGGDIAVTNAIVVTDANCLGAGAAALDERNTFLGGDGLDAEYF